MARCIDCKRFIMKKMRCTHRNRLIPKEQMYKMLDVNSLMRKEIVDIENIDMMIYY